MRVTEFGTSTDCKEEQPLNACFPILVMSKVLLLY